jgi:RAD51-like protein 2
MATKLLSAEGKRVNFDTGEKAVLMPQLGKLVAARPVRAANDS